MVIDYTLRGTAAVCSLLGKTLSLCQCTTEGHTSKVTSPQGRISSV